MEQRILAAREPDLTGLRVLVVGLGRSGLAAVRLAAARGAQVTATDLRSEERIGEAADRVRELGAVLHAGGNPPELVSAADLIVVSPGVPPGIDLLRHAAERELPVWGECELASRFCRGRIVGITGSNGKSTVTTMIGSILEQTGLDYRVGGNLDTPFAELLDGDSAERLYVLELSSFQIETLQSMRPEVAVILNLSPDHLDRYASCEDYGQAKARLLELQSFTAAAVLNADDDASRRFESAVRGRLHRFSVAGEVDRGGFLRDKNLVLRLAGADEVLMPRGDLPLPGDHNVANALAAAVAARLAGCAAETIAGGLRAYRALPHRLEHVATIDGVSFFNDSKATNPDSTACALAAFEAGRVHLILGGRDKGGDWSGLADLIRRKVRRVLLVGESAATLGPLLRELGPVDCGSVAAAVTRAADQARAGDVVLLSPGCASFDQYTSFQERGEDFKRAVRSLERGGRDA